MAAGESAPDNATESQSLNTSRLERICPNCQSPLLGEWCYSCGQRQRSAHREFIVLLNNAFDDVFSLDSRTTRTLIAVLARPGFLTREYFAGRRARYIPPLRLYLVASVIFFFILSVEGMMNNAPIVLVSKDNNFYVTRGDMPDRPATIDANSVNDPNNPNKAKPLDTDTMPSQQSDWHKDLVKQIDAFNVDFLTPTGNQVLRHRLKAQVEKAIRLAREDPQALIGALINAAPPVMFMLVPLFAVLIMLFYLGSGRYYAEHLVLAAHNQSFVLIILILDAVIGGLGYLLPPLGLWGSVVLWTWVPIYLYWSLRTIYGQGYFLTLFKFLILGLGYWILFILGVGLALLFGLMTL